MHLRLLWIFLVTTAPSVAVAQDDPYQVVGFTTATFQGDAGLLALSAACQAEFGAAARICSGEEVVNTVVIPALTGEAWYRPSFSPVGASTSLVVAMDASGLAGRPGDMSCTFWSDNDASAFGPAVTASGNFMSVSCDGFRSVACCAPVPLPEPSSMLLHGTGVAALGLFKLAACR